MKILPGVEIVDLGLYFEKEKILAVTDFHLGYEAALAEQGVFVPRHQTAVTIARLEKMFNKLENNRLKTETIVILGDIRHEFGHLTRWEIRDVTAVISLMKKHSKKIILLKGNHDTIKMYIERMVEVKNELVINNILFLHGDKLPTGLAKQLKHVIIGHEHPAIKISDGVASETVKCFLKGKWKHKDLIVIPSFNILTEGTNMLSEKLLSPFLKQKLDNFEAYAVTDDGILAFGKLKSLKSS